MAKKAPIKIPKLYPTETIEIEGNKIVINGMKAADKPFEIAVRHLRNQAIKIQAQLNRIVKDDKDNLIPDRDLSDESLDEVIKLRERLEDIMDDFIYIKDDNGDYELGGPLYLMAQRGIKRFYYPDKNFDELDSLKDIPLVEGDIKLIANTMMGLSEPPRGLERSIDFAARKAKKDGDKGK